MSKKKNNSNIFNWINVILSITLLIITIIQVKLTFFYEYHDLKVKINKFDYTSNYNNSELLVLNNGNVDEVILNVSVILDDQIYWDNILETAKIIKAKESNSFKMQILSAQQYGLDEEINFNNIDSINYSIRYKYINQDGNIDSIDQFITYLKYYNKSIEFDEKTLQNLDLFIIH